MINCQGIVYASLINLMRFFFEINHSMYAMSDITYRGVNVYIVQSISHNLAQDVVTKINNQV